MTKLESWARRERGTWTRERETGRTDMVTHMKEEGKQAGQYKAKRLCSVPSVSGFDISDPRALGTFLLVYP